jgi:hypothetical protein
MSGRLILTTVDQLFLFAEAVDLVSCRRFEPGREIQGNQDGERVCTYDQRDTKVLTTLSVYPDERAGFDSGYEVVKQTDPVVAHVRGIGEAAFVSGVVRYALKGAFIVVVVAGGGDDSGEAEAKLHRAGTGGRGPADVRLGEGGA